VKIDASDVRRAVAAAMSTASGLDLAVGDAIVLHNSNKLAVRLLHVTSLPESHMQGVRLHGSKSSLLNSSPKPRARWLPSSLEWRRAPMSVTAS
jgi:hypothetical protein